MEKNLVSVVVPVYNVQQFLEKCLNSLKNQSYGNLEIIMVDDGSPDESYKICQKFSDCDIRFRYIRQENKGLAGARNTGIRNASGDYIIFVDSDDYIDTTAVEEMLGYMQKYQADMVVAGYYADIENDGKLEKRIVYHSDRGIFSSRQEIAEKTIAMKKNAIIDTSCNKMYRLDIIKENCIFMPDGELYEDTEFIYRLLPYIKRMYVTDKAYYHYMQRNVKRITNSFNPSKFKILSQRVATMMTYYESDGIVLTERQQSDIWFWMIRYSFSCLMDLYLPGCPYNKKQKKKYICGILKNRNVITALSRVEEIENPVHKILVRIMKTGNVTLLYTFARILYFIRNDCKKIFFIIKKKGV